MKKVNTNIKGARPKIIDKDLKKIISDQKKAEKKTEQKKEKLAQKKEKEAKDVEEFLKENVKKGIDEELRRAKITPTLREGRNLLINMVDNMEAEDMDNLQDMIETLINENMESVDYAELRKFYLKNDESKKGGLLAKKQKSKVMKTNILVETGESQVLGKIIKKFKTYEDLKNFSNFLKENDILSLEMAYNIYIKKPTVAYKTPKKPDEDEDEDEDEMGDAYQKEKIAIKKALKKIKTDKEARKQMIEKVLLGADFGFLKGQKVKTIQVGNRTTPKSKSLNKKDIAPVIRPYNRLKMFLYDLQKTSGLDERDVKAKNFIREINIDIQNKQQELNNIEGELKEINDTKIKIQRRRGDTLKFYPFGGGMTPPEISDEEILEDRRKQLLNTKKKLINQIQNLENYIDIVSENTKDIDIKDVNNIILDYYKDINYLRTKPFRTEEYNYGEEFEKKMKNLELKLEKERELDLIKSTSLSFEKQKKLEDEIENLKMEMAVKKTDVNSLEEQEPIIVVDLLPDLINFILDDIKINYDSSFTLEDESMSPKKPYECIESSEMYDDNSTVKDLEMYDDNSTVKDLEMYDDNSSVKDLEMRDDNSPVKDLELREQFQTCSNSKCSRPITVKTIYHDKRETYPTKILCLDCLEKSKKFEIPE